MPLSSIICEINQPKGKLKIGDKDVSLRPKTFKLLLLLASRTGEVISKDEIMNTVWPDTVVEDQVVFQSINEIRKEVGIAHVIKTYPRRGYSWEVANTILLSQEVVVPSKQQTTNPVRLLSSLLVKHKKRWGIFFILAALMSILAISNSLWSRAKVEPPELKGAEVKQNEHYGLLVLPFNVTLLDNSKKWLKFGAMEGVIKWLSPSDNITVFHLEDAIDILNRLSIADREVSDKIFQKSGASYILQTSLSGVPGEYRVIATVHSRYSSVIKAFTAKNIDDVIALSATYFSTSIHQNNSLIASKDDSQFQNELIIKAIQFLEKEDYQSAIAFLESALINDRQDLIALYFLVTALSKQNSFQQALDVIEKSLLLSQHSNYKQYQPRLLYYKGVAQLALGNIEEAMANLNYAQTQAETAKDWLYYSYTKSMIGKINQQRGNSALALNHFNEALAYQELLQCPLGITQSYLDLAEFHLQDNSADRANQYFKKAEKLVFENNLTQAKSILEYTQKLLIP